MANKELSLDEVKDLCVKDDPEHWMLSEDTDLNDCDEVTELLSTGSVTTTIGGKEVIVSLKFEETA